MTTDLSSVAREVATKLGGYSENYPEHWAYVDGFTECASRLPSDEDLATEMKRHHFAANMLDSNTWGMWMSQCGCGWESSEFRCPGESSDAYYAHAAGAVLALIEQKLSS